MSFTDDGATTPSTKVESLNRYWSRNEQRLRDIQKFEGLKGVIFELLDETRHGADLAAAQEEVARLRAAIEEIYPPLRSEYFDKNEQKRQHAYVSGYEAALADVREALK